MSVVLVDWLGRGGIAQTTEAWAMELLAADVETTVVTRPARELGSGVVPVASVPDRAHRLAAHRAVAVEAARQIRDRRPDVVVVQNYVAPVLERPVYAAARAVRARIVVVVHDHRLHTAKAGTRAGLRGELRRADAVVTHTRYVARGVSSYCGRHDLMVVPHPAQVGVLQHAREPCGIDDDGRLRAVTLGVLKRSYKGSGVFEQLAADGVEGWSFLAVGTGAPDAPGIRSVPGYVSPGRLTEIVAHTDATLAPYTHATQSGVVVLAHVLGSVPIATAVGGIPEQITPDVDGLLLPPGAPLASWRDAVVSLTDEEHRKALVVAGEARAWREHATFRTAIRRLVA